MQEEQEKGWGQPSHGTVSMTQHLIRPAGQEGLHNPSLLWPPKGQATGSLARSRGPRAHTHRGLLKLNPTGCKGAQRPWRGLGLAQKFLEVTSLMGRRQACREVNFPRKGFQGSRLAAFPTPHPLPIKLDWPFPANRLRSGGHPGVLGKHWRGL